MQILTVMPFLCSYVTRENVNIKITSFFDGFTMIILPKFNNWKG